jgi:hypothetical protein
VDGGGEELLIYAFRAVGEELSLVNGSSLGGGPTPEEVRLLILTWEATFDRAILERSVLNATAHLREMRRNTKLAYTPLVTTAGARSMRN